MRVTNSEGDIKRFANILYELTCHLAIASTGLHRKQNPFSSTVTVPPQSSTTLVHDSMRKHYQTAVQRCHEETANLHITAWQDLRLFRRSEPQ